MKLCDAPESKRMTAGKFKTKRYQRGEVQPALPHLHLLPLALVLIRILPLPLLVLGAILGVVSSATTSEASIVIGLTVLLLWLIVVPLN
jgi:hypothetical protein